METGVSVDATTNEEGNFQVPFLLPGNYSVAVTLLGSRRPSARTCALQPTAGGTAVRTSSWGWPPRSVTVDAQAPLLETAESDLGGGDEQ